MDKLNINEGYSSIKMNPCGASQNMKNSSEIKKLYLLIILALCISKTNAQYLGGYADGFGSSSIGTTASPAPLPIKLLDFTADFNGKTIDLKWVTGSEINNDYFTVERSVEGFNDIVVGTVPSKAIDGTSINLLSYMLNDPNAIPGTYYYRLKQTDFDGKYEYSKIISAAILASTEFTFELYPNPNNGKSFSVSISGQNNDNVLIVVRDVLGQEIYTKLAIIDQNNSSVFAIDPTNELGAGVYIITATSNNRIISKRLVVQQ